ncbi:MAG: hypothetical protein LBI72_10300 [Flavobacteriaceae bacterium]|jgi:hypothetical protein|nr:hypothetical protein [Flavobacteriaceae bacterium]
MNTKLTRATFTSILLLTTILATAQNKRTYVRQTNTTIDSIYVSDVKKGGVFLKVDTYFLEYDPKKPALKTTYEFKEIDKNGNMIVKYSLNNKLINFKLKTNLEFEDWTRLNLVIDSARKEPMEVNLQTKKEDKLLRIQYLNQ